MFSSRYGWFLVTHGRTLPMLERVYPRQPPGLLGSFKDLWGRNDPSFDIILENSLDCKTLQKHGKRIKAVVSHRGIAPRLKQLVDDCPFLWKDRGLDCLSRLAPLLECFPRALQNYLDHMLLVWRSEILINGIRGASESISKESLNSLSGSWPQFSRGDREKFSSFKTSPSRVFALLNGTTYTSSHPNQP